MKNVKDLRITFLLWVPLFLVAITAAILQGFQDIFLFAIAMGLALWAVCEAALLVYRKTQQYLRRRD